LTSCVRCQGREANGSLTGRQKGMDALDAVIIILVVGSLLWAVFVGIYLYLIREELRVIREASVAPTEWERRKANV
jgi:hypothetical protein